MPTLFFRVELSVIEVKELGLGCDAGWPGEGAVAATTNAASAIVVGLSVALLCEINASKFNH